MFKTGGAGYLGSQTSFLMLKKKIQPIIVDKLIYKRKNIIPNKSITTFIDLRYGSGEYLTKFGFMQQQYC